MGENQTERPDRSAFTLRPGPCSLNEPWFGRSCLAVVLAITLLGATSSRADAPAAARLFVDEVEPILTDSCYTCHADGQKKGNVAFDGYASVDALVQNRDLWWSVLKNVRSGVMPPAKKSRPSAEQVKVLENWIKREVFGTDPSDPDPGRVTIRRLNRVEYGNTIRDLMGIEFQADEEFPPDDTGFGFDNIGDVLSVSPLLLEKYMKAAEAIVAKAVPTISAVVPSAYVWGQAPGAGQGKGNRDRDGMDFYKPANVSRTFKAEKPGTYRLVVEINVRGAFDFDPGRCKFVFKADGKERITEEYKWEGGKTHRYEFTEKWEPGDKPLAFELTPLTPPEDKVSSVDLRIASLVVEGPIEREHWVRPKNFDRFFTRDDPGTSVERKAYARETLARFARKAYRRPADDRTLDRLLALAEGVYEQPGKSVEQGIAESLVAMLSSPRFLFRVEDAAPEARLDTFAPIDEYALASRLSYFLWSTMPDQELFSLAERGELRKNLAAQVKRMVADPNSERLVRNFVGQWLQARDVEGVSVDAREILARDDGVEKELKSQREEFQAFLAQREVEKKKQQAAPQVKGQQQQGRQQFRSKFPRLFGTPKADLDGPLRQAMRRETEMFFGGIVHDNLSVLDLIDSDYTFLNERLAKHYGVPGVSGEEMRKVSLPADSPRGGLLTQGTILIVTSNPTRTSPVKRGLFILDNILGTPAPPPPPAVPQLEDAEKQIDGREPTLREVLQMHRAKPLCSACHSRMDPLGLALESFNALGMWRDKERNQPLDTAGSLITGEPFAGIKDLKHVLKTERRMDFYRCLTEKLLTYALGRGLDYTDVESVDRIVDRLEREQGKFSALLTGVIESAPFQKRRNVTAASPSPSTSPAQAVSPDPRTETTPRP